MENKNLYQPMHDNMAAINETNVDPPSYQQSQPQPQHYLPPQAPTFIAPQINTTVAANPNPTSYPNVGPESTEVTCPQCRCRIKTTVRHRSTAKTHIACLLLSWTCICCCLPYCMNSCRNANHFCPMCGVFIGTYQS